MSVPTSVPNESIQLSSGSANSLRFGLLGIGVLGLLASGYGWTVDSKQFYFSWLAAFAFTATIGLGCFFFTILQHLVAARWSVVVRRVSESISGNLFLLALLFIPVLVGAHDLYEWTHAEAVATDHLLHHKEPYLNMPFFSARAAFYFLVWGGLGLFFYRTSRAQDSDGDVDKTLRMRTVAAPSILLFGVTITFSGIDWYMSLEPHWFSTIFGVYIFAGAFVSALALLIVTLRLLQAIGYLNGVVTKEHYHDLGKLLLGFTVFWTYISFSQYFLIWYSNIPEETYWFLNRWVAGWKDVSIFIVFGHFVVPFLLLLSRHTKRRPTILASIAVWIIIMHYVDLYWVIMPVLHKADTSFHWLDITALMSVFGLFLGALAWRLGGAPLIPVRDPFLKDSLEFENV